MIRRVAAGLPALTGMFARAEVTYAWLKADGSVGSDQEAVAIFSGEVSRAWNDMAAEVLVSNANQSLPHYPLSFMFRAELWRDPRVHSAGAAAPKSEKEAPPSGD
jgi:hypothetical protein